MPLLENGEKYPYLSVCAMSIAVCHEFNRKKKIKTSFLITRSISGIIYDLTYVIICLILETKPPKDEHNFNEVLWHVLMLWSRTNTCIANLQLTDKSFCQCCYCDTHSVAQHYMVSFFLFQYFHRMGCTVCNLFVLLFYPYLKTWHSFFFINVFSFCKRNAVFHKLLSTIN